jgi:hypothetical protein
MRMMCHCMYKAHMTIKYVLHWSSIAIVLPSTIVYHIDAHDIESDPKHHVCVKPSPKCYEVAASKDQSSTIQNIKHL